jgi:hypothetical protein
MDRRRFLRLVGVGSLLSVAGCVGITGSAPDEQGAGPGSTSTAPSEDHATVRQWAKEAEPRGPERADGTPVSAERTVTDKPGYEQDDREYFPSNDTIRYVSLRSGGEPVEFDTWSFEEWGTIESSEIATVRAGAVAERRLGVDGVATSVSHSPTDEEELVAIVQVTMTLNREGEVVSWPAATFPDLKDAAPRSIDVTVSIEGDSFSRTVPVYAEYTILQNT